MRTYLLQFPFLAVFFAFFALISCGDNNTEDFSSSSNGSAGDPSSSSNVNMGNPDLDLENAIIIKFNGDSVHTTKPSGSEVEISLENGNLVVRVSGTKTEYNLVVSGTTVNSGLKIYGDYKIGLYLNGVSITNPKGPAINIQNGKKTSVNLVNGTNNYLEDGEGKDFEPTAGESAKGTFFSEGQLVFSGDGTLKIKSKRNHAIVSEDYFEIESGNINITESANDGIHTNDGIFIKGGTLDIKSKGDALQSEKDFAQVSILGGKIDAYTSGNKSHGISSADSTIIGGNAKIMISVEGNGAKGIKSNGFVSIRGGTTDITTRGTTHVDNSGESEDESNAHGIKAKNGMEVTGGTLNVETTGKAAKGISVDGDFTVKGGTILVDAYNDGIKTSGNFIVQAGNVTSDSYKKDKVDCGGSTCDTDKVK
jgi:hypothetical protein